MVEPVGPVVGVLEAAGPVVELAGPVVVVVFPAGPVVVVGEPVEPVIVVVVGAVLGVVVPASVVVWGTADVDVEVVVDGALDVLSSETLAVAEKLALTEIVGESSEAVSDGGVVGVSVSSTVLAGSGSGSDSGSGSSERSVVEVSASAMSPGVKTSLGVSETVFGSSAPGSPAATPESGGTTAGSHERFFASFARAGGSGSARTTRVVPMTVAANAAATPARVSRRRSRSADDTGSGRSDRPGSSVLSTVCIQLLLSPRCRAWLSTTAQRGRRGCCQGFE
ncbi:hypothetical protein [Nocardia canadensis]|uniref:hypothetical protein n=1 Tax=Nocardia canadensis TaxID=3065238 RepID=UPI00292CCB09|nr:hypothetical protein [Nocardia canadensis]